MGDLSKLIVAKRYKKLPKVQNIAKSGHTDHVMIFLKLKFQTQAKSVPRTTTDTHSKLYTY